MPKILTVGLLALLAGCSSMPKPAGCEGSFRPVNAEQAHEKPMSPQASMSLCQGTRHV